MHNIFQKQSFIAERKVPYNVRNVSGGQTTSVDWLLRVDERNMYRNDCEMIRPPPLMWPGDGSYPSEGGVVSVGVHVACYWSGGGAS